MPGVGVAGTYTAHRPCIPMGRQAETPGEKLEKLLKSRGISPTRMGEMLREQEGLTSGYQLVKKWIDGRGFNTRNRLIVARILDVDPELFDDAPSSGAGKKPSQWPSLTSFLEVTEVSRQEREFLEMVAKAVRHDPGQVFWAQQVGAYRSMSSHSPRK
jgi:hypothetical protein